MAQAGLTSTAESLSADPHFIDATPAEQRAQLLKYAGVVPTHHGSHAGHTDSHTHKKGKGKGKKSHAGDLEKTVAAITKGVMQSMHSGPQHTNHSTHNKDKPYFGVTSKRLEQVYTTSQNFHTKAVDEAVIAIDSAASRLPLAIRSQFNIAFTALKLYRTGNQGYSYDNVYEKISAAHTVYAGLYPRLKYTMHVPKNVPIDRKDGLVSLLSKLMSLTIDTLQVLTSDTTERKTYGYYEFKTLRRNITEAKKNSEEVHQACVRAVAREEKASEKQAAHIFRASGGNPAHVVQPLHLPGHHMPRAQSEFGTDHGSFSMAQPFA